MNKKERTKRLVGSIDHAEKRISYLERLKQKDDYDIIIVHKADDRESEVIENGYEIINQIIYSYRQSLQNYNKELDRLLSLDTTKNKQHTLSEDGRCPLCSVENAGKLKLRVAKYDKDTR